MAMKRTVGCSFLQDTFPPQTHTTRTKHPLHALKGNKDSPSEPQSTSSVQKENASQDVAFDVILDFPPLPSPNALVRKEEEEKTNAKINTNIDTEIKEKTSNNFASAAKQISEEVKITLEDVKRAKELLRKDGNGIFLNTPQEVPPFMDDAQAESDFEEKGLTVSEHFTSLVYEFQLDKHYSHEKTNASIMEGESLLLSQH
ncbi:Hypothetical predicted protein [Octopus vulgaris]|uniref:Uncharacterized protein n=1 Tax=Octopus vulgaris TaxID=6645 RepID=A0AA36ARA9_OCTVU|nr:Hypothetical predicted protein [Octopus vulgaris]